MLNTIKDNAMETSQEVKAMNAGKVVRDLHEILELYASTISHTKRDWTPEAARDELFITRRLEKITEESHEHEVDWIDIEGMVIAINTLRAARVRAWNTKRVEG